MQQWEYKVITGYLDDIALDEIGKNGWEMCGAIQLTRSLVMLYFKRSKTQEKRTETSNVGSVSMKPITDDQKSKLVKDEHRKPEENESKDSDYWK